MAQTPYVVMGKDMLETPGSNGKRFFVKMKKQMELLISGSVLEGSVQSIEMIRVNPHLSLYSVPNL